MIEIQDITIEGTGSLQPTESVDDFEEGPIRVSHEAEVVFGEATLGRPAVVILAILQEQVHVELLVGIRVVHHTARDPARSVGIQVEFDTVCTGNEVVTCAQAHRFEVAEPKGPVVSRTVCGAKRVTHHDLLVELHMGCIVDGGIVTLRGHWQVEGGEFRGAVNRQVRGDRVECGKAGAVAAIHQKLLGQGEATPHEERAGHEKSCRHDT